jgi:hypothetical protein
VAFPGNDRADFLLSEALGQTFDQQAATQDRSIEVRLGHQMPPEAVHHDRHVGRRRGKAAECFGKCRADQAQLSQFAPESRLGSRVVEQVLALAQIMRVGQETIERVPKHPLVIGVVEIH